MRGKVTIYTLGQGYVKFGPRLEHTEWNELFREHDVSVVMNLQREDVDNFQVSPLMYIWLPSKDAAIPPETLCIGANFLNDCADQDLTSYVHCRAGVNRAPQMAVAYLLRQGISLKLAIEQVQYVRPKFKVNENIANSLKRVESMFAQYRKKRENGE